MNKTHNVVCRAARIIRWRYMNGDESVVEDAEIILSNKLPKLEKVEDNVVIID